MKKRLTVGEVEANARGKHTGTTVNYLTQDFTIELATEITLILALMKP